MTGTDEQTSGETREDVAPPTRVLVLWQGGGATHLVSAGENVIVGRHGECRIVIDLPSVSRRHARITGGKEAFIEDLGGMNGVLVRGKRIPVGQRVEVTGSDVIEMGGALLVIQPSRDTHVPRVEAGGATFVGEDPMRTVDQLVELVAQSELTVLLLGESGVGKSVTAEAIHERSRRARGPFVCLDCTAAAELGDEDIDRLLREAAGGTLLFDEVAALPLALQDATLAKMHAADVRLVCTTHSDLLASVRDGAFRRDLYERLNGISILIPPLRERRREIPKLALRFLTEACARQGRTAPVVSRDALGALLRHPFLGNLRELRNAMEHASVLARGREVEPRHLVFETAPAAPGTMQTLPPEAGPPSSRPPVTLEIPRVAVPAPPPVVTERDRVAQALEACKGNQTRAAAMLGMSRGALSRRIDEYGLPRPRPRSRGR